MTQTPPPDPAFPASTPPPPPPPGPAPVQPGQAPPPGPSAPPGPPPSFGNEPPPAGGFGAPPPAPGKKKNTPLIIVLGVLVAAVVVIGGIALFAAGDDDDGDTAGSNSNGSNTEAEAEDVVLEFIDAEVEEDCDAMVSLMSSRHIDSRGGESEAIDSCESEYEGYGGVTYEEDSLEMTSSGDETVTFAAEETLGGESYEATYNLIKEDGKWRIDSLS